jgi:hypothetical protein
MTTPTKIRQDEDERLLEEYIRMKPSRAIDRLLSEYSIDKGFLLYNMLQYFCHYLGRRLRGIQPN